MPGTSLTSYEPSLRDKLAWMMGDMFGDNRTLRNWAQDRVRGSVDLLPVVGDAVGFDDAKRDFDAGNYGSAAVNAGLSAVGSVPGVGDAVAGGVKAGGHALGMLVGPMSRLYQNDMAEKATQMLASGADALSVKQATGMERNPLSGIMEQEISDAETSVDWGKTLLPRHGGGYPMTRNEAVKLGDFLKNNPSVGSYDKSNSIKPLNDIAFWNTRGGSMDAVYHYPKRVGRNSGEGISTRSDNITANFEIGDYPEAVSDDEAIKSAVLHEVMHGIQMREGWDGGRTFPNKDDYADYQNAMGERQARRVQARMKLTPEEIANSLFYDKEFLGTQLAGPAKRRR